MLLPSRLACRLLVPEQFRVAHGARIAAGDHNLVSPVAVHVECTPPIKESQLALSCDHLAQLRLGERPLDDPLGPPHDASPAWRPPINRVRDMLASQGSQFRVAHLEFSGRWRLRICAYSQLRPAQCE